MSAHEPKVVESRKSHLFYIAGNMRDADAIEVMASSGMTPLQALLTSREASTKCWTVIYKQLPIIMFGVAPISHLGGVGAPWMLATPYIEDIAFRFARHSRRYVNEMNELYPKLMNMVHVDNQLSVNWLRWLGFDIQPAIHFGRNGEEFHPFERRAA